MWIHVVLAKAGKRLTRTDKFRIWPILAIRIFQAKNMDLITRSLDHDGTNAPIYNYIGSQVQILQMALIMFLVSNPNKEKYSILLFLKKIDHTKIFLLAGLSVEND